jgi:hypothetical protein
VRKPFGYGSVACGTVNPKPKTRNPTPKTPNPVITLDMDELDVVCGIPLDMDQSHVDMGLGFRV